MSAAAPLGLRLARALEHCSGRGRDVRHYLNAPFTDGGWTYATNGYVAIRVPAMEGFAARESVHTKDAIDKLVALEPEQWHDLVLPPAPEWPLCNACGGSGHSTRCLECDGEGERECDLGHMHDCDACGGDGFQGGGTESCYRCFGAGRDKSAALLDECRVCVGGAYGLGYTIHFDWRLLERFADLPDVQIGLMAPCTEHKNGLGLIRFQGGRGVVMPIIAPASQPVTPRSST